ncbi:MAG TPA: hypothetical protein VK590_13080, partial [Saprospiraceae bacterium]|nr:hypothetical protein [Saprospiraceae bacterium]
VSKDITSISLTAGDWDVWGNVCVTTTTGAIQAIGWINTVSVTLPDASLQSQYFSGATIANWYSPVAEQRFSLAGTTTLYLSANVTLGGGTGTLCGAIYARRVR